MKIIITESQYKKILIREFGETIKDPKRWYKKILKWVNNEPKRLNFDSNSYETVVYDDKGIYLGYYDKEGGYGLVVTEYGIGVDDYTNQFDEEILDEEEGGDAPAGGTASVWPLKDVTRGVANPIDNSPWSVEPARGPANQLT
jgi:hypothetical protein